MNWYLIISWIKSILLFCFALLVLVKVYNWNTVLDYIGMETIENLKYLSILLYAFVYILELKLKLKSKSERITELESKLKLND